MRRHRQASTIAALAMSVWACDAYAIGAADNPAIIVLPNARNVRTADIYDGRVDYEVLDPYPAKQAIDRVRQTLQSLGWQLRERDFLNPTHRIATTATWHDAEIDGRVATTWSEQWENGRGDVVSYGYTYWSPRGQSAQPNGPLHVSVTYFRATLVRSMSTAAEKDRKRRAKPAATSAPPPDTSSASGKERFIGPVLEFETHGVEFAQWVRGFVTQVRKNWAYHTLRTMKDTAQVVIAFEVDERGTLSDIEIVQNARDDVLNRAAVNALRASSPTAPLPMAYPKDAVRITARFSSNPGQQPPR